MRKLLERIKRKFLLVTATFVWLLMAVIFLSNYVVVTKTSALVYDNIESVPYNRVGLLLGTSKYTAKNYQNQYFVNRIRAAAELYHAGKIEYILISGDNRYEYYNEPQMMQEDLIELGVPKEKIFLDYAGFRTLDSVIRAKKVFGLKRFTVISQRFHNERALFIAQNNGLNAVGYNAKDVSKNYGFKTNLREKFARVKVVLDMMTGKEPKFLGEQIEIK
jgi:SanA protein